MGDDFIFSIFSTFCKIVVSSNIALSVESPVCSTSVVADGGSVNIATMSETS